MTQTATCRSIRHISLSVTGLQGDKCDGADGEDGGEFVHSMPVVNFNASYAGRPGSNGSPGRFEKVKRLIDVMLGNTFRPESLMLWV